MGRKRYRPFSVEVQKQIIERYESGCSVVELAVQYDCNFHRITAILRRHDKPVRITSEVSRILLTGTQDPQDSVGEGVQDEWPSLEEIEKRKIEVKEKWDEETHRKRAGEVQDPYEFPVVRGL